MYLYICSLRSYLILIYRQIRFFSLYARDAIDVSNDLTSSAEVKQNWDKVDCLTMGNIELDVVLLSKDCLFKTQDRFHSLNIAYYIYLFLVNECRLILQLDEMCNILILIIH